MSSSGPFEWWAVLGPDWRCTTHPDMYVDACPACGADRPALWVFGRTATCINGCAPEAIIAARAGGLGAYWLNRNYERDLRATMEPTDPLYDVSAWVYFPAIVGREPDTRGWLRCPFHAAGEERTPSLQVHDHPMPAWWKCHACERGGTVYDLAAEAWGIEPRRDGFHELRERIAAACVGVSWPI